MTDRDSWGTRGPHDVAFSNFSFHSLIAFCAPLDSSKLVSISGYVSTRAENRFSWKAFFAFITFVAFRSGNRKSYRSRRARLTGDSLERSNVSNTTVEETL